MTGSKCGYRYSHFSLLRKRLNNGMWNHLFASFSCSKLRRTLLFIVDGASWRLICLFDALLCMYLVSKRKFVLQSLVCWLWSRVEYISHTPRDGWWWSPLTQICRIDRCLLLLSRQEPEFACGDRQLQADHLE